MFSSVAANDSGALRWRRTRGVSNCKRLETRRQRRDALFVYPDPIQLMMEDERIAQFCAEAAPPDHVHLPGVRGGRRPDVVWC